MKKLILFFAILSAAKTIIAQDIIIKIDKTQLKGKVIEVSVESVKYKKQENPDGPSYSIDKANVFMVLYENGSTYVSDTKPKKTASAQQRSVNSNHQATDVSDKMQTEPIDNDEQKQTRQLNNLKPVSGIVQSGTTTAGAKQSVNGASLGSSQTAVIFFNKTPDDLTQYISDELKKSNFTLDNIDDVPTYGYDEKGKKTSAIYQNMRILKFSNGVKAFITSDENDQPYEIDFSINTGNPTHYNAIKRLGGFTNWPRINITDTDTTYFNKDIYATASGYTQPAYDARPQLTTYYVSMIKATPYNYTSSANSLFKTDSLSVYNDAAETGHQIVNLFKSNNLAFLYRSRKKINADYTGKLLNYVTQYNFENGSSSLISTNATNLLTQVYLNIPSPILFSKLKKSLNILQWELVNKNEENRKELYSKDNVDCNVDSKNKNLTFTVRPMLTDINARLKFAATPSFSDLLELYKSSTSKEDVAAKITRQYLNMVKVDWEKNIIESDLSQDKLVFYFNSPMDSLVNCKFNYDLTKDNSLQVSIFSYDKKYMSQLNTEYAKNDYSDFIYQTQLSGKPNTSEFNRIALYNKKIEVAIQQQRDEEQALARARREEEQAQAQLRREEYQATQAQREKEKAEKQVRTSAVLQKLNDEIIKFANSRKKN